MLMWLIRFLIKNYPSFHIFSYLTFRAIASLLTSMSISLLISPAIIYNLQKASFDQTIRKNGPSSHFNKKSTPTMGGIIILISLIISVTLWSHLYNPYIWYVLAITVSYGVIGFFDDYKKIIHKETNGIVIKWKLFWMSLSALILIMIFYYNFKNTLSTKLIIPFIRNDIPELGWFYVILSCLVIVGTGNAVNLTDGLDGLAIMSVVFVASGFAVIAWISSINNFTYYLHVINLQYAKELVIICTSIIGSGLGFLWFNTYPAQIFMGDLGSLALGGTLGMISVLLNQEFLLIIMGGVFVIETISVILQIGFYKLYGKRIFYMTPIHHHYELKGYPEPRITIRFWIISVILVLIGLSTLGIN